LLLALIFPDTHARTARASLLTLAIEGHRRLSLRFSSAGTRQGHRPLVRRRDNDAASVYFVFVPILIQ
jgi:hypothetical protein